MKKSNLYNKVVKEKLRNLQSSCVVEKNIYSDGFFPFASHKIIGSQIYMKHSD